MTTRQALEQAYDSFFSPENDIFERREIFAEEIGPAVFNFLDRNFAEGPNANNPNPASLDQFFDGSVPMSFLCTKDVTQSLAITGKCSGVTS